MWFVAVSITVAYLLGAVPFALVVGRLKGVDIRTIGSGNIGATNLTRALGRRWGTAAFLLDFFKGLVPTAGGLLLTPLVPSVRETVRPEHIAIACGAAAVIGHLFPIYLRFRGGKGVATSFGVICAVTPLAAIISGVAWLGIFFVSHTVSVASLIAAGLFPVSVFLLEREREPEVFFAFEALALLAALLIVFRHTSNIRRLLAGKESRF